MENEDFTLEKVRNITAVTGTAAYPLIKKLAEKAEKKYNKLKINVEEIKNTFFGESVTVSGLLTGQDIAAQLAEKSLGDAVLVPDNALRDGEEVFLDDITLSGLSEKLGVPVIAVQADGYELLEKFLGINEKESE